MWRCGTPCNPALDTVTHIVPLHAAWPDLQACAKGGAGAYSAALQRSGGEGGGEGPISGLADAGIITASHFRTYHPPLNTQADFIHALSQVRAVVAVKHGKIVLTYGMSLCSRSRRTCLRSCCMDDIRVRCQAMCNSAPYLVFLFL